MALVDFKKIPLYKVGYEGYEPPVLTEDEEVGSPSGPWTGTVYNENWGYFTFEQSIEFDYAKNGQKYTSSGVFTINGVFTVNAEMPPPQSGEDNLDINVPVSPAGDEERFNVLKAKYDNLRSIFAEASRASAPEPVSLYGTNLDPRCIYLPDPLRGPNSERIYARPISFRINESQWPNLISYTVVLKEVIQPTCKVTIDDVIIDKGVITITVPKPRLNTQNYAFANSSEMLFFGWDAPVYSATGVYDGVPPSGQLSTDGLTGFMNNLMDGRVTIGKALFNGDKQPMFEDLFIDNSSVSITPNDTDQGVKISLTAKE